MDRRQGPVCLELVRRVGAVLAAVTTLAGSTPVGADQDAPPSDSLAEGDVLGFEDVERLRPFLPEPFYDNRDFFFYEGMQLEIGPPHRDYSPAKPYLELTKRFRGEAKLGPDGSLQNYQAGTPFHPEDIDCTGDPQAGAKIMWNFDYQWEGDGVDARYYYSYWDRGEELPLFFEGTAKTVQLAHRAEQELAKNGYDLFRRETRKHAFGLEVNAPFDARGLKLLSYRYKSSDGPRAEARNDDMWVYAPVLRRVRRISTAQRSDAVSGTDFTFDDLRSFAGIVPQYEWTCVGERVVLAPMNTKVEGYPRSRDHNFGPHGVSYADDRWELRRAYIVRMVPKSGDHPYRHKDLYIDQQTFNAHYSFAYDRKGELWKVIWHNKRWSGDELQEGETWYAGWDDVPEPRDSRVVSDVIVNVQTGTGNRIEFWDAHGTPLQSAGKVRRYIDVGRLIRGGH